MEVIRSAHSVYRLKYHVVWVCKYRRRILNSVCTYIHRMIPALLRSMPGVEIETIGFDKDHVHMVIIIPPKYSIASVMGQLKSQSASKIKKMFQVAWKSLLEGKYYVVARLLCQ